MNALKLFVFLLVIGVAAAGGYIAYNGLGSPTPATHVEEMTMDSAENTVDALEQDDLALTEEDAAQEMAEDASDAVMETQPDASTAAVEGEETTAAETTAETAEQDTSAAPATAEAAATATGADNAIDMTVAKEERILGSENAPITMIEYASMTCPHCGEFNRKVLPDFKKKFIDTGKVKMIFRDFPLDKYAFAAAKMARCMPADQYFNMVEVIFANQDRWMKSEAPLESLAQLGALAGMSQEKFNLCTASEELETLLLERMQEAQTKYQLSAVPAFVFNGGAEVISGYRPLEEFEAVIERFTGEKKQGE